MGGEAGRKTNQALVEWMASKGAAPDFLLDKDWRTFNIEQVIQAEIQPVPGYGYRDHGHEWLYVSHG